MNAPTHPPPFAEELMFPWRACLLYARLSYALLADDPFAKRAKAGLGLKRTITVDELGKMEAGPSRVQLISSAAELKKALTAAGRKLVVVDFFATWCGPCKQIAPQFAELSGQHKKVVFLKVDVDKCPNLAATHGVTSMPTFLFLKGSKVVSKQAGASIECKLPAGLCGAYNSSLPSRTRTNTIPYGTEASAAFSLPASRTHCAWRLCLQPSGRRLRRWASGSAPSWLGIVHAEHTFHSSVSTHG